LVAQVGNQNFRALLEKNWASIEIFRGMTTKFLVIGSMAIVNRTIKFVQATCKCFFWGIPKKFNHHVW
jgi:hypothetical protein